MNDLHNGTKPETGIEKLLLKGGYKLHLAVYTICVLSGLMFARHFTFSDHVYLAGDEWEYQTLAVNLVNGHGFPFTAAFADSSAYKLVYDANVPTIRTWKEFYSFQQKPNFYRTPLYPFFIAAVYKLFSVSPAILRYVQLILLILGGSLFPFICSRLWGSKGILAGIVSYALFLYYDNYFADMIMCEPLMIFYLILFTLLAVLLKPRQKPVHAIAAGSFLALGLLLKLHFVPFVLGASAYATYLGFFSPKAERINAYCFFAGLMLTILPWTIYANYEASKFSDNHPLILITTYNENELLLGTNNDYSADGGWHPEWTDKANSFYNQPETKNYPATFNVAMFYLHHPSWIPYFFTSKIMMGLFATMPQLLFYLSCLAYVVLSLVRRKLLLIIAVVLLFAIVLIWTAQIHSLLILLSDSIFNTHHAMRYLLIAVTTITLGKYFQIEIKEKHFTGYILYWMLANFALITLVYYGNSRMTGTVDFICIILTVHNLFEIVSAFIEYT